VALEAASECRVIDTTIIWQPNTFNDRRLYPKISFMGRSDIHPLHPAKRGIASAQEQPVKDRLISGNGCVLPLGFFPPIIATATTGGVIESGGFTHGCVSSVL